MFHVTSPFGGVADFGARTGQATDGAGQVVDAGGVAVGDVEHAGRRGLHGEVGVGGHDVFDVNKIPGLFTIAVDADGLVPEGLMDKDGHGGRILAPGILARAEHVEIPQTGRR